MTGSTFIMGYIACAILPYIILYFSKDAWEFYYIECKNDDIRDDLRFISLWMIISIMWVIVLPIIVLIMIWLAIRILIQDKWGGT